MGNTLQINYLFLFIYLFYSRMSLKVLQSKIESCQNQMYDEHLKAAYAASFAEWGERRVKDGRELLYTQNAYSLSIS